MPSVCALLDLHATVFDSETPPVIVELMTNLDQLPVELDHFADCIRTGKPPRTPGSSGRAVIEAISAAYLSVQEGWRVDLPLTRLPDYETLFKGIQRRLPPRYQEAVQ